MAVGDNAELFVTAQAAVNVDSNIYMGTVGTRGAYRAMRTGYVEPGWAREHHELWYQDIQSGKIPARRSQSAPAKPRVPISVNPVSRSNP